MVNNNNNDAISRDLIGRHLSASTTVTEEFTTRDVLSLIMSTSHAGADTTSTSSAMLLARLLLHQDALNRLEIEFQQAALTYPPQFNNLVQLPYLRVVVNESMYVYSEAFMLGRDKKLTWCSITKQALDHSCKHSQGKNDSS